MAPMGLAVEVEERGGPPRSGTEAAGADFSSWPTSDEEIDPNPHRPKGFGPNGTVFVVAPHSQ